jgi:prophage antirepressor-like protein
MTATLQVITHNFNNTAITTYIFEGRPCWVALEVGRAIGYSGNGKGLVDQLRDEWSAEMVEGQDFAVLAGDRLKSFQDLTKEGGYSPPSSANQITVLYETGIWLVLVKTRRPAGLALRRFLVEQVLPQLARDGRYLPEREVTEQGQMQMRDDHALRLRDMEYRERELDMRIRQTKAHTLVTLIDSLPYLSDDIRQAYRVKAAEEVTGQNLSLLLPPAAESLSWESPTQIGERLGVSANTVGKAITALGLRGTDGLSRAITNKALHSDRTVVSYLYSPEAADRIADHLRR